MGVTTVLELAQETPAIERNSSRLRADGDACLGHDPAKKSLFTLSLPREALDNPLLMGTAT